MFNLSFIKRDRLNEQSNGTSKLIKHGVGRDLYETQDGFLFWLDKNKYLDKSIIDTGRFELKSSKIVFKFVRHGNLVLDIGANIGYYTVIFSKLVGKSGKIIAFEPTKHYEKILKLNLQENNINNCEVFNIGLSNKNETKKINIGECSATMHWVNDDVLPLKQEEIRLETLDEFISKYQDLNKIDFIKIDVDGHEPLFFEGARNTLKRFDPLILLEVSHEHYLNAGYTAWDFYEMLRENNFYIYSEEELEEIQTKHDFLVKCGNFAYSSNILISKHKI
jgi:FkbM family methyltransferase